jgi:hypothetical protein
MVKNVEKYWKWKNALNSANCKNNSNTKHF